MGLFSRRRDEAHAVDTDEETTSAGTDAAAGAGTGAASATGPWDAAAAPDTPRIDLGSLRVPAVDGMQMRLDQPREGGSPVALVLALGGSTLELRAFAAPRSDGIWEELRADITAELTRAHASLKVLQGPHGTELLAQVPVRSPEGDRSSVPARFIGVDGPRWFLRGVLQGRAATDDEAAAALREVFDDVVVVRDSQARPPREVLPLHVPGAAPAPVVENLPGLAPLEPGPTIAEVR
ncbi:DUF3710 domain-containing protein [Actinomyces respiraculi]|uniref:DUF3710 domain-containing protein n=1 Tax=Actinomyces respiraculi TaxID=2744574 RepID=UPI00141E295A|nr:DUF3710 domain-containing protein [Actinomyces respiraculi]